MSTRCAKNYIPLFDKSTQFAGVTFMDIVTYEKLDTAEVILYLELL